MRQHEALQDGQRLHPAEAVVVPGVQLVGQRLGVAGNLQRLGSEEEGFQVAANGVFVDLPLQALPVLPVA
jgi:hypothetical protein